MPFTFSHPAIILPLTNKREKWKKVFSTTGLLVGSIAPDFESFIRLDNRKIYSHTWSGIFWFDLPLSLIICIVFHLIVRDPLIENLPAALEERFELYRNSKWFTYLKKNFFTVTVSLLIGITSHLLWDAATHLNFHDPDSTKSMLRYQHIRVYIILQYTCSLAGLLIIAWAIYKMPRTGIKKMSPEKFKYWLYFSLIAMLMSAYLLTTINIEPTINEYMTKYALFFINAGISSMLASLIIVSFFYKLYFGEKHTS